MGEMPDLVVKGQGSDTATNYIAAAATKAGDLLVAYVPPAHDGEFSIDVSAMKKGLRASWLDPSNGRKRSVKINNGKFRTPGKNAIGDADWVLIIK